MNFRHSHAPNRTGFPIQGTMTSPMAHKTNRVFALLLVLTVAFAGSVTAQNSALVSADTYRQDGKLDRAWEKVEQATKNEKTAIDPKTWLYRGQILRAIANDSSFASLTEDPLLEAKASLVIALEYDQEKGKYEKRILNELPFLQFGLFNGGAVAYSASDYETAHKYFLAAYEVNTMMVTLDPQNTLDTSALFNAALTADRAGMTEKAKKFYEELIEMKYDETALYRSLANIYMEEGDTTKGLDVIALGRENFPESQELLIHELNVYLMLGRAADAIDKFQLAIERDPDNPELYFAMGTAYQEMMKLDKENMVTYEKGAENAYLKVLEINPQSFQADLNLGALYYNKAIEINKSMAKVDLDDTDTYEKLKGERDELYNKALPYFESAAKLWDAGQVDPSFKFYASQVWESLKEIYAWTGDMDRSTEAKDRMMKLREEE